MTKLERLTLVKVLKQTEMKYSRWQFAEGPEITHLKS